MLGVYRGKGFSVPEPVAFDSHIEQLAHRVRWDGIRIQVAHTNDGRRQNLFGQVADVRYLFPMSKWPTRIPFDLYEEIEARQIEDWQAALRVWAKHHGLKLKIQWYQQLEHQMADLHSRRYVPGPQDHWAAIKESLEQHEVPVPENLPGWPEQK